ncbi:MAG: PASTA domain-containing protein [Eubacteriaceae bacterium]|nr:PASTA domain-containing protein [Eubacteriaceae bacterium]
MNKIIAFLKSKNNRIKIFAVLVVFFVGTTIFFLKADQSESFLGNLRNKEIDITTQEISDLGQGEDLNDGKYVPDDDQGRDLSNDPEYIESLKKIYSEDEIKMISEPRRWLIVPNVVGMTESKAVSTLKASGFVGRVSYQDSGKNIEEGICYYQDTAAGTKWNTDASFFIFIQTKDEHKMYDWSIVPNVRGKTESEAISILKSNGLVPRITYEDSGGDFKDGICFRQDYEPGTERLTDSFFYIWIQRTEKPQPVVEEPQPNVEEPQPNVEELQPDEEEPPAI